MKLVTLALLTFFTFSDSLGRKNNVCETSLDYAFKDFSPRCRYNPDVDSSTFEMVARRGYKIDLHDVVTEDGYNLGLFHILPKNGRKKATPVFLQHGFIQSSDVWVCTGNRSLAFVLQELGYDVWLGNFRGNRYSRQHLHETSKSNNKRYWDFSFQEKALYDLSAMLNYISDSTKTKGEIVYVGHSMGTTTFLIYNIIKQLEAERNLRGGILLAPVANTTSVALSWRILAYMVPAFSTILRATHKYDLATNVEGWRRVWDTLCSNIFIRLCQQILFLFDGQDIARQPPEGIPIAMSYFLSGESLGTLDLYAQNIRQGGILKGFDHGRVKNQKIYGSAHAPVYDVSKIKIPVHLFYGNRDKIGDPKDVVVLHNELGSKDKSITMIPKDDAHGYNHNDFMMAKDLGNEFYPEFLGKLKSLHRTTHG